MPISVLIVEDIPADAAPSLAVCEELGWKSIWVQSADEGLRLALQSTFNLMILDRQLNDGTQDGIELIERLKQAEISVAVIILSADTSTDARISGLDGGADVYLSKPVDSRELRSQLVSVARRLGFMGENSTITQVGKLELSDNTRRASWEGTQLNLTEKGYLMVRLLARSVGDIVSRQELWREVWPEMSRLPPQDMVIDTMCSRLRRELSSKGAGGLVKTARGKGFYIEHP